MDPKTINSLPTQQPQQVNSQVQNSPMQNQQIQPQQTSQPSVYVQSSQDYQQPSEQQIQQPNPPTPQSSTSLPVKESEPLLTTSSQQEEYIQPSTPDLILHPEVKAAGVEVKSEISTLTNDQQNVGVTYAKDSTPVKPIIQKGLSMQTPKKEIFNILHIHKHIKNSIVWLATLILRQLKAQELKGETES